MTLIIEGTDPCWFNLHEKLKTEREDLCNKNIYLAINHLNFQKNKKNIIWLHESPGLLVDLQNKIKNDFGFFINNNITVYTCIDELFDIPFVKSIHPSYLSWINPPSYMPNKTHLISMISSAKNYIKGHRIRQELIKNLPYCVDLYGFGFNPIENKKEGLEKYCFSIAIENDDTNTYYSEKILDCFLTCTIPIYWGTPNIIKIFDSNGIIFLKNIEDICNLTYTDYNNRLKAVENNFNIALQNCVDPYNSLIKILEEN